MPMKNSNGGFSLIEVMISLAISAAGTLALLGSVEMSLKAQRNVASLTDFDTFQNQLKMFTGSPNLCAQSLVGPTGPLVIPNISTSPGAPQIDSISLAGEVIKKGTRLSSGSTV